MTSDIGGSKVDRGSGNISFYHVQVKCELSGGFNKVLKVLENNPEVQIINGIQGRLKEFLIKHFVI